MDGGREYSPNKLIELAEDLGQVVELTTPYTPEQDGTSERSIGIVCERTRTAMIDLNIPAFLWPMIFDSMIKITNRTATATLEGKTPYQAVMDEVFPDQDNVPYIGHFRVLGCKVYIQIPKERRLNSEKVKAQAELGILVGYEGEHIFQVYVPSRQGPPESKIVRSSNVRFDEGGLITEPESQQEVDVRPVNRGEVQENEDREPADLLKNVSDSIVNQDHQPRSQFQKVMVPEVQTTVGDDDPIAQSGEEATAFDEPLVDDNSDIETEPEPEPEEPQLKKGRPVGSKNKVHKRFQNSNARLDQRRNLFQLHFTPRTLPQPRHRSMMILKLWKKPERDLIGYCGKKLSRRSAEVSEIRRPGRS